MKEHTKSRHGCLRCKQRKVKCDETLPACKRCLQRREKCSYLEDYGTINSPPSRKTTNDSPSLNPPYLTQTYATLWGHVEGQMVWRDVIFQMALTHRVLLDGLLATAAIHRIVSSATSNPLSEYIALQKQTVVLEGLRMILQSSYAGSSEILFPVSTLVAYWAFASRSLPEGLNILSTSDAPLSNGSPNTETGSATEQFLLLVRRIQPTRAIVRETRDWLLHGSLSELARIPALDEIPPLSQHVDDVISELESHLGPQFTTSSMVTNNLPIFSLRSMFRLSRCPDWAYLVVGWPMQLSEDFLGYLKHRDPAALTILAFWAVCFDALGERWWAWGWSRALVLDIGSIVPEPWRTLVQWPKRWLGLAEEDELEG
ncbi:hypothetical protein ACJZ2D_010367 [Fusarium nematophilum]